MVHSPARWPPYGRLESSRLLEVDHYMLHMRIKMRSCGWVACSRNTDADTGEGYQEFIGAVCYQRYGCLDMDVHTSRFEPLPHSLGPLGRRMPAPRLQRRLWQL
jgi:hypothetical protein